MSDASPGASPAGEDDASPDAAPDPAAAPAGEQPQPLPSALAGVSAASVASPPADGTPPPAKGPLSYLSGALTSGLLAWLALGLSRRVVAYYSLHPPHYEAQVAQSIATALKTLIVGMCFLATFSFAFVGAGLLLVFLRSLLGARPDSPA